MAIEVRPTANRDEEQQSLDIYNVVCPRDAVTIEDVDSFKRGLLGHVDLLAWLDGRLAGSAFVAIQPSRPHVAHTDLTVLLDARQRGVGTALYRAASTWCAARGIDAIETRVAEDDEASLAHATRRGFVEIERYTRVVLELTDLEPAPVAPPPGIEIVTWADRPDLTRGIYEVATEAYADMPGSEEDPMEPFEDWLEHDMRGAGDQAEATFVALAGDEVVGYAKFSLTAAQPAVAHHDTTGVRRAWRGRGVAGALKRAQIAWAKAQGYERLATGNELRNTPIRKLNERLGYRPHPGRVLLHGPLAGPSD
jgi:GNAT superfamily N-acetyltransferase